MNLYENIEYFDSLKERNVPEELVFYKPYGENFDH